MDLEDFKSFCRVLTPSEVGSIPTRSRHSYPHRCRCGAEPDPEGGRESRCRVGRFRGKRRSTAFLFARDGAAAFLVWLALLFVPGLEGVEAGAPGGPPPLPGNSVASPFDSATVETAIDSSRVEASTDTIAAPGEVTPALVDTAAVPVPADSISGVQPPAPVPPAARNQELQAEDDSLGAAESFEGPVDFEEQLQIKRLLQEEARTELLAVQGWERKKKPGVAMLSALAFPGLGQLYNGRRLKGIISFGVEMWLIMNIYANKTEADRNLARRDLFDEGTFDYASFDVLYEFYKDQAIDFVWFLGAFMLVNLLDVYVDAHLYDFQPQPTIGIEEDAGELSMRASFSLRF